MSLSQLRKFGYLSFCVWLGKGNAILLPVPSLIPTTPQINRMLFTQGTLCVVELEGFPSSPESELAPSSNLFLLFLSDTLEVLHSDSTST